MTDLIHDNLSDMHLNLGRIWKCLGSEKNLIFKLFFNVRNKKNQICFTFRQKFGLVSFQFGNLNVARVIVWSQETQRPKKVPERQAAGELSLSRYSISKANMHFGKQLSEPHAQANANTEPNPNEDAFEKKKFLRWTFIMDPVVKSLFTNGLLSFLVCASSNFVQRVCGSGCPGATEYMKG